MKQILLIIITLFTFSLSASHVAGGNISYAPTNNASEFEITLTLYRDCTGFPMPLNYAIIH